MQNTVAPHVVCVQIIAVLMSSAHGSTSLETAGKNIADRNSDRAIAYSESEVSIVSALDSTFDENDFLESLNRMFKEQPARSVSPKGWIKEFLRRMEAGLTGHPEESGFPFNTDMWAGEMDVKDREYSEYGSDWWPYEQTAYYLDGALRCGYLNQSQELIGLARRNLWTVIENARENGSLVPRILSADTPIMAIFFRMALEEYENSQDVNILAAIERHYLAFYGSEANYSTLPETSFSDRTVLNVEILCRLAEETRRHVYLDMAERLYDAYCKNHPHSTQNPQVMLSGRKPGGHAVVYHEFLKLPAIMYLFTGRTAYLEAVKRAIESLSRYHVLADGLSSGVEGLAGNASNQAHETCNVPECIWAYGWALKATGNPQYADNIEKVLFNAGMGSITKDFKAHQYYSSPNLITATLGSHEFHDKESWGSGTRGRMCYRPGHDTECCTGAIHKMMPLYIKRMWLRRDDEITATLYGPCSSRFDLGHGKVITIEESTAYPFENQIEFSFSVSSPLNLTFQMRIPSWSTGYTLKLNGRDIRGGVESGCFIRLRRKFLSGDKIGLRFHAKPVIKDRGKGMTVEYGALVFSLPLEAKKMLITKDDQGKCSPAFPMYLLYPHSSWNYALSRHLVPDDVKVLVSETHRYPWDVGQSPVKLAVGTARIVKNWGLKNHVLPTDIPDQLQVLEQEDTLQLEPLGSTLLRLTVFAKGEY